MYNCIKCVGVAFVWVLRNIIRLGNNFEFIFLKF